MKEQANNRTNNHLVTFNGVTRTIAEWADALGTSYQSLHLRLSNGWSIEEALTIPPMKISRSVNFRNVLRPLKDWCEAMNIEYNIVYARIFQLGWSVEYALTTPIKSRK